MITVPISEVAAVLESVPPARSGLSLRTPFPPVSIDSRRLKPGDCFVAIPGENFDGHDFIGEAITRGARVVIHSESVRSSDRESGVVFLRVSDTTLALQKLAREVRRRWGGPVVAVTGSMGKTTTRRFSSTLLQERFRVCESPGNLNNHFGVPLSLLGLQDDDEVAVLELGMNHAGEIHRLSSICRPDVAVLTNIAPVHLESFQSLEEIAAAKAEVLDGLRDGGTLLFNGEDARLLEVARGWEGPCGDFGTGGDRSFQVSARSPHDVEKMEVTVRTPTGSFAATVPFSGNHHLYNMAAAVAVSATLGLSDAEIERGFEHLAPARQRGRILNLIPARNARLTVIDESYNSNPRALSSVLEDLAGWGWKGRKVAVLGDMLELGPRAVEFHLETGRHLAGLGIDLLLTVGELATHIGEGAVEGGMPSDRWLAAADSETAAGLLRDAGRDGDLVLVKASRGVGLDRMIRLLERAS